VKSDGLKALDEPIRSKAQTLIDECSKLGLFVVPNGELEGWMNQGVSKGRQWNRGALEELHNGHCPTDLKRSLSL